MSLWARSDLASITVSAAHGGCAQVHTRPAPGGNPDPVWKLDCVPCESHLRSDPLWSATLSEVPETPDETKAREDFEKRGALDRDGVMAMALAKLAGVELPETLRRPISGLAPHIPAVTGAKVLCEAGHDNEPGMKFCGECGASLRAPVKRTCPDGHEVVAKQRFCGECGKGVEPAALDVRALEPAAAAPPGPKRRLKDRRLTELQQLARDKGLDDSGTRGDVLARLQAAA